MRPVLFGGLAFVVVIALVVVFFVSIGIGAANFITACGINPALVLIPPASEPKTTVNPTPSASATSTTSPTATSTPQPGTLFAAFQAQPSFTPANQAEQRKNAATIVAIGLQRPEKFSDRDIAVAVATAIQESNLINKPYLGKNNDHTSLGLFQQQTSVGTYGSASDIMNINHSINAFYDRLAGVANRNQMSMIDIAIKIQIPNLKAYHARWKWDDLAKEIVGIYHSGSSSSSGNDNICSLAAGVSSSGDVHLPLDPGYHVSDGFNDPRPNLNIGSKPHIGIDLVYGSNTLGRPVYAAFSGTVVQSGYGGGCNKSSNNPVMILSADGLETGYLHMNGQQILVKKGDTVVSGQRIGSIGSCGQATGPHLHFEVTSVSDHEAWLSTLTTVNKYGSVWLDPNAIMAHYGVKLLP
ncbi:MAG: Peptidase [Candidatus Saccharibacteria bacterium]|nr:Peptidase [Candidatus Saccharibacteria bacterium]